MLCRNGIALEMSIDHKPEDEPELNRIHKAGGKVTCEGRVNGGLNLSRALGGLQGYGSSFYNHNFMIFLLALLKAIFASNRVEDRIVSDVISLTELKSEYSERFQFPPLHFTTPVLLIK